MSENKFYGWYSAEQAKSHGEYVWRHVIGIPVVCSCVSEDADTHGRGNFAEGMVFLGEVTKYVGVFEKANFPYPGWADFYDGGGLVRRHRYWEGWAKLTLPPVVNDGADAMRLKELLTEAGDQEIKVERLLEKVKQLEARVLQQQAASTCDTTMLAEQSNRIASLMEQLTEAKKRPTPSLLSHLGIK